MFKIFNEIKNNYKKFNLKENIILTADPYKNNISYYETLIQSFDDSRDFKFPKYFQTNKKNVPIFFPHKSDYLWQAALICTGYVYIKCCFSGEVLRSNRSFAFRMDVEKKNEYTILAYQFITKNNEIFYLFSGTAYFLEYGFWYPKRDFCLQYYDILPPLNIQDFVNYLKNNIKFNPYKIINTQNNSITLVSSFLNNIAHYVWNDISGLNFILKNNLQKKINKFLFGEYDFLNISSIIKIKKTRFHGTSLFDFTYNKKETFASFHNVNIDLDLNKYILEKAQNKYKFKLPKKIVLINIRSSTRKIKNQEQFIAELINHIHKKDIRYQIIIDGHSSYQGNQVHNRKLFKKEIELYNKILIRVNEKNKMSHIIGYDIYKKIAIIQKIDFFISYYGSPDVILSRITNKPGIVHLPKILKYQAKFERKTFTGNLLRFYIEGESLKETDSKYETHNSYLLSTRDFYRITDILIFRKKIYLILFFTLALIFGLNYYNFNI